MAEKSCRPVFSLPFHNLIVARQVHFSNEVPDQFNLLPAVAAGLIRRMDDNLFYKLIDDGGRQFPDNVSALHLWQRGSQSFCKEAVMMGYTSHQAGTCGLHIHVSRLAFGEDVEQQDACIARVLYFFEKHWEELLKFSRRTPRQLERWAARYGLKDHPMDILDHAKKGYGGGRYSCVNLQNTDTIEFRIFRGTLKYNTLIATLQLVDRICDVVIHLSDDELKAMSWTTFVSGCRATELVQYLKERRIYVNEPVSGEEEL